MRSAISLTPAHRHCRFVLARYCHCLPWAVWQRDHLPSRSGMPLARVPTEVYSAPGAGLFGVQRSSVCCHQQALAPGSSHRSINWES